MARPMALPPPSSEPARGWRVSVEAFLLRSLRGRVVLGALLVWLLSLVAPVPNALAVPARVLLAIFALWAVYRLLRHVLRRLLWRIRTKLIVSYLFIGLVPVLLLALLFFIAGVLGVLLVASHLVDEEMTERGRSLRTAAEVAAADLPADDAAAAADFGARLESTKARHPGLAATLLRRGRVVASWGNAPRRLPAWWKGTDFAGLAGEGEGKDVFRMVSVRGDTAVLLDLPVDRALFASLAERSGIQVLSRNEIPDEARGERSALVEVDEDEGARVELSLAPGGLHGVAVPERLDWATGERKSRPLAFRFQAVRSPEAPGLRAGRPRAPPGRTWPRSWCSRWPRWAASFSSCTAWPSLLGLLLARSITRSIHDLSPGHGAPAPGRLRRPASRCTSRDQLGELAESFNLWRAASQDLLREPAEKERLEEELRIARQIQMSLLPPSRAVAVPGLRVAALCLPAAEVGGDYYDLLPLSDDAAGRAGGRRLGQGHLGRALHGGAEGAGALALAHLRLAGRGCWPRPTASWPPTWTRAPSSP